MDSIPIKPLHTLQKSSEYENLTKKFTQKNLLKKKTEANFWQPQHMKEFTDYIQFKSLFIQCQIICKCSVQNLKWATVLE